MKLSTMVNSALSHVSARRNVVQGRAIELLRALGVPDAGRDPVATAVERLREADRREVWLALAVLTSVLPMDHEVVNAHRALKLDGAQALRQRLIGPLLASSLSGRQALPVRVLSEATTVDVFHTARTHFATGIQRVVRESTRRWAAEHEIHLLGWGEDLVSLRELSEPERATALYGAPPPPLQPGTEVLVPWNGTYLLPELAAEPVRTRRILALARYGVARSGAIGFDCVPLTTAETVADGMGGAFALQLSALREMDRIATISHGAAVEYRGWGRMLEASGLTPPEVKDVFLATEAHEPTEHALECMQLRMVVGHMPMVVVVGSHEPRKNHLAVLHAAELLWREGLQFSLSFIGGVSWNSDTFAERLEELVAAGRPIDNYTTTTDDDLWAAYKLATVTIFPSVNEGFGLPVAESLSIGTPAITSGFGSMREIADAGGGAVLVDPRDDDDIAAALRRVLTDHGYRTDLQRQALARPRRSWDDYATDVWDFLVGEG